MNAATKAASGTRAYLSSDVRRRQIVEVAIELMAARGLAEVSMRDVAAEAGVPLSSVSYHFGSRDELLRSVMETMTEKFCDATAGAAPAGDSLSEVLAGYVDAVSSGSGYSPGHHMLLLEFTLLGARNPDSGLAAWQYERYEAAGRRMLDQVCERTGATFVGDRGPVIRLALALLEGATLQQLAAADPAAGRPLIEHLTVVLEAHLRPVGDGDVNDGLGGNNA